MGGILREQVPACAIKPVEDFQGLESLKARQRRHPRIEHLDPALRTFGRAVPGAVFRKVPGRVNSADEPDSGVVRRSEIDGYLVFPRARQLSLPSRHQTVGHFVRI